ncbi:hypothetical protein C8R47DRAFT_1102068 [Mycena vitilis]|nr:hypothetical protein C8R47DRAFT_1102068 [Mycena vitilis]
MSLPSFSSLFKFYLFLLTRRARRMAQPSDPSRFAVLPPSDQRWTTVPAWIQQLRVLPDADTYRVAALELYKDPKGIQHEWIRFTLVDSNIGEPVPLATIKTDRCSSVNGGSSIDVASSPSKPGEAFDRIIHALDPAGADLLGKGAHLIMETTYEDLAGAPSILDVAAALTGIHVFTPNYDAISSACFNYAIACFLLITEKFPDCSPVRILGKRGYAANIVNTARWATVLKALKITDHVPPEKSTAWRSDISLPSRQRSRVI